MNILVDGNPCLKDSPEGILNLRIIISLQDNSGHHVQQIRQFQVSCYIWINLNCHVLKIQPSNTKNNLKNHSFTCNSSFVGFIPKTLSKFPKSLVATKPDLFANWVKASCQISVKGSIELGWSQHQSYLNKHDFFLCFVTINTIKL